MREIFEITMITAVVAFSLRRAVFLVAAMLRPRVWPDPNHLPSVAILVPARNEGRVVGRLLGALDRLRYPVNRLSFIFVCDGCVDTTPKWFSGFASGRENARVLELPARAGKAAALNAGLAVAQSDIVVVLDADLAPSPDAIRELVRPFKDPGVGATAAFLRPANADSNVVTRYAAVTTWVHQLITSAALDRLGLNPPTLGASAYRRSALGQIGGFPVVPAGEDVATSTALTRDGWRTSFIVDAVVDNIVVATVGDYLRQHVRWSRSVMQRSFGRPGRSTGSGLQRVESLIAAIGYGDRVVFLIAAVGAVAGILPIWLPLLYVALPGVEILAALRKAASSSPIRRLRFLVAALLFFVVDVASSLIGVLQQVTRRPVTWHASRPHAADRAPE